ncbi:MAG: serine/threonine-protein kinase [Planctomycetota bacterium]
MRIADYEVQGEIARGGAGVVYRARHRIHGTPAAIKLLLEPLSAEAQERFRREAHVTFRLRHPHVVGLLEWGTHQGHPYLVLELVEGSSLERRLRAQGPLPARLLFQVGQQLADALHYAHGLGLVHRDIKPANVLLEASSGRAVLTDFGLAQVAGADQERITVTGEVVGTPAYMSPEQAQGLGAAVGPASDIYSLGATLYAALCGRPPVEATTPLATMTAVVQDTPPHPLDVYPAAHPALAEIALRCLAKDPAARFPDAAALREALADASRSAPAPAGGRRLGWALGAALVAGGVGLGWALGRGSGSRAPAPAAAPPPRTAAPEPAPLGPLDAWVTPYSHLLALRAAAASGDWRDQARLALGYAAQREPRLAYDALAAALEGAEDPAAARALRCLRARLAFQVADPEQALADAQVLLEADPRDVTAWRLKAQALLETSAPEAALAALDEARRLGNPEDLETTLLGAILDSARARFADAEGRAAEAEALRDAALGRLQQAEARGCALSLIPRLRLRLLSTSDGELRRTVDRLLELDPMDPTLWRQSAILAEQELDAERLLTDAYTAYDLDPNDFTSASLMLGLLLRMERYQEAASLGEVLLQSAPGELVPRFEAGLAYALSHLDPLGQGERILELAETYRGEPTSEARLLTHAELGLALFDGDYPKVLRWLEPLGSYPGAPAAAVGLDAELLRARWDAERGLRSLGHAHQDLAAWSGLGADPTGAASLRGALFLRQGLPRLAVSELGADPLARGSALLQLEAWPEALEAFEEGAPRGTLRVLAYARALRGAGQEPRALTVLRESFPQLSGAEAAALERAGREELLRQARAVLDAAPAQALAVVDELLLLDPEDLEPRLLLARAAQALPTSVQLVQLVEELLRDTPGASPALLEELSLLLRDRRPGAASMLQLERFRDDPSRVDAATHVAGYYCRLGRFAAAEALLDDALRASPGAPSLRALRAVTREAQGLPEAEAELAACFADPATGPGLKDLVALHLGRARVRAGAHEAALAALEPASSSQVADLALAGEVWLAVALHALGRDPARVRGLLGSTRERLAQGVYLGRAERRALTELQVQVLGVR